MIFPLLQNGPGNEPPGGRAPITEAIIILLSGAIGLGIKYFKKNNNK